MKRRAGQIAKERDLDRDETVALAKDKLSSEMWKAFGKDVWLTEEGQELLIEAIEAPELVPRHYSGRVLRKAPNPRVVYAQLTENGSVVPVIVPKRLSKGLVGKLIKIEGIEDAAGGCSYRRVKV